MNLTIDTCVFVSAARPSVESYAMSNRFLQRARGVRSIRLILSQILNAADAQLLHRLLDLSDLSIDMR